MQRSVPRWLLHLGALSSVLLIPAFAVLFVRMWTLDKEVIPYSEVLPYIAPTMFFGIVFFLTFIAYLVDIFRSERVPEERRTLWLVLLLAIPNAVVVYWWLFVKGTQRTG